MSNLVVAAVQISCTDDVKSNLDKLEMHVRHAASRGAKLVVLQELFEGTYFALMKTGSIWPAPDQSMATPPSAAFPAWPGSWA